LKGERPGWAWFFGGFAAVITVVAGCASLVAICARDRKQLEDAFKVLKYVGSGGVSRATVAGILLKLHQAGLL
jgi:hypothetical protein